MCTSQNTWLTNGICDFLSASSGSASFPIAGAPIVPAASAAPAVPVGNFGLLSQTMTSPSTPVVPPFQPNPAAAPVMGMAAPMQQQQRPPLGTSFLPTTKPVQPVPPMQLMSQQQPPMFSGGGMNPVMGTVGAPGMLTNTNRMSTWSDVKGDSSAG